MIYCFSLPAIKRIHVNACEYMALLWILILFGVSLLVLLELQLIGHYMEVPFSFILLLCIQFPMSRKKELDEACDRQAII